ncbi:related to syntaxin 12, partial [Cephalotrichum gorgonifer]
KQQKYERNKISTEFQDAFKEFQDLQRQALDKQRASVSAARAAAHEPDTGDARETGHFQQQQQQQELSSLAVQSEVDFQDALIVEREEEIRNIEQGVGDLNVLFRQVAQIVSEQGEQLNTIADNVEVTRDDTRGAMVELGRASNYQKSARKKGCFLLLIASVILMIVLLAIFVD